MSPLDYSCKMGHHAIVSFLLDNEAMINDIDRYKHEMLSSIPHFGTSKFLSYNCLDIAIENNQSAVVEVLLTTRPFEQFVISRADQCAKLANLVKSMPLSMKILLDNCFDSRTNMYSFDLIDDPSYKPIVDHPLWLIAQHQHKYLLGQISKIKFHLE